VVTLHRSSGVKFRKFPQLLVELRRIIWTLACRVPQVHILVEEHISRSRINDIYNISLEAREVVLGLELDHFIYIDRRAKKQDTNRVKNYFDPQLDTIWINRQCPNFCEDVDWTCGRCWSHRRDYCGQGPCISVDKDGPAGLYRMALNLLAWKMPGNTFDEMGSAELHLRHGVTELLLVVGDYQAYEAR